MFYKINTAVLHKVGLIENAEHQDVINPQQGEPNLLNQSPFTIGRSCSKLEFNPPLTHHSYRSIFSSTSATL